MFKHEWTPPRGLWAWVAFLLWLVWFALIKLLGVGALVISDSVLGISLIIIVILMAVGL